MFVHQYYFPSKESLIKLQERGADKRQRKFFAWKDASDAKTLYIHISFEQVVVQVVQQGTLQLALTHEILMDNFRVFLVFLTSILSTNRAEDTLKKADDAFLRYLPMKYLQLEQLNTTCRLHNILNKYLNKSKADLLVSIFENQPVQSFASAMRQMRTLRIFHPSLLCCFGLQFEASEIIVQISSQTLMKSDMAHNDVFDMIFENMTRSGKLFQEPDVLEPDVGVMTCEDGTNVYSFHDPQWYAKLAYEIMTPKEVEKMIVCATSYNYDDFCNTEPNSTSQSKIQRKAPRKCDLPVESLQSPHPRSFQRPIMEEVREAICPSDFSSFKSYFHKDFVNVLHKLWYFRSKVLDILSSFRSGLQPFLRKHTAHESRLRGVQEEAYMEAVSLAHYIDWVGRVLERVPLNTKVTSKYQPPWQPALRLRVQGPRSPAESAQVAAC